MAITNGYATVAELKARMWPSGVTPDGLDDLTLERLIETASRWAEARTGQRFWKNAVDEARVYTAETWTWVSTDELVSVTSVKTDEDGDGNYETTWSPGDYKLLPMNSGLDGKPYTAIAAMASGGRAFPKGVDDGVQVTGVFGWGSPPKMIQEATLMKAQRLYKRRDMPLGVGGNQALGTVQMAQEDTDLEEMIRPFVRYV